MAMELSGEPGFGHVVRQMSKMMDQMQKGYFNFCPSETWTPSVNVYENDTAYVVCVDLAGVDKDQIDLVLEADQLRLRGSRPVPVYPEPESPPVKDARVRVHLMEIDHGAFCREINLPEDVDRDRIEKATYSHGMLWIRLPKK